MHIHPASEFVDPLPHSGQPYSAMSALSTKAVENVGRNALSIISYLEHDLTVRRDYGNLRAAALGMAVNIGQALLQNAEQRKFEGTGQAAEVTRHSRLV